MKRLVIEKASRFATVVASAIGVAAAAATTLLTVAKPVWAAYARANAGDITVFEITLPPGEYLLFVEGQGDPEFSVYRPNGTHLFNSKPIGDDGDDGIMFDVTNRTQTAHIWVRMNTCNEYGGCAMQVVTFNYDPAGRPNDEDGWGYFDADMERLERRPRY